MDSEDVLPWTRSKTLNADIRRMISIETETSSPNPEHTLSAEFLYIIKGEVTAEQKKIQYCNSLRK